MPDTTDQMARDWSKAALARIEAHERVCAEHGKRTEEKLDNIKEGLTWLASRISGFESRLWAIGGGVVVLLISVVGILIKSKLGL